MNLPKHLLRKWPIGKPVEYLCPPVDERMFLISCESYKGLGRVMYAIERGDFSPAHQDNKPLFRACNPSLNEVNTHIIQYLLSFENIDPIKDAEKLIQGMEKAIIQVLEDNIDPQGDGFWLWRDIPLYNEFIKKEEPREREQCEFSHAYAVQAVHFMYSIAARVNFHSGLNPLKLKNPAVIKCVSEYANSPYIQKVMKFIDLCFLAKYVKSAFQTIQGILSIKKFRMPQGFVDLMFRTVYYNGDHATASLILNYYEPQEAASEINHMMMHAKEIEHE